MEMNNYVSIKINYLMRKRNIRLKRIFFRFRNKTKNKRPNEIEADFRVYSNMKLKSARKIAHSRINFEFKECSQYDGCLESKPGSLFDTLSNLWNHLCRPN